jgi:hypothetical protein
MSPETTSLDPQSECSRAGTSLRAPENSLAEAPENSLAEAPDYLKKCSSIT